MVKMLSLTKLKKKAKQNKTKQKEKIYASLHDGYSFLQFVEISKYSFETGSEPEREIPFKERISGTRLAPRHTFHCKN